MPVYFEEEKKVEIWSDVTIAGRTDGQTTTNKERWNNSANGQWTAEMSNSRILNKGKAPFFNHLFQC